MIRACLLTLIILSVIIGCSTSVEQTALVIDEIYNLELEKWRIEKRESRNNYLKLAGLFKLEKGQNTFGSGTNNTFVFEIPDMPEFMGTFNLNGDSIYYLSAEVGSELIPEFMIFDENKNSQI